MLDDIDHPQNPAENQIQHLIKLYNQSKLGEVFEQTSTLIKQYNNSLVLWSLLGVSAAQIGKLDKAVDAFKKALSIQPNNADAYYNLGNVLHKQGKLEEAVEAYKKLISIKPDNAEAYLNIGNVLHEQGKLEEAVSNYNKAISIKPEYADAYNNLGNALKNQGKLEEAIEAYNKVLSIKPDTDTYYNMGNALKEQGKLDEAVEAYNKAISIKPDYAEAYNNMGIALQDQGKPEEAIKAYTKTFSIKPEYVDAHYNMGNVLYEQGRLEEAIKAYKKALSIKPEYVDACNNMGIALKDQGKLEEAIKAYKKALSIKPEYADAYNNMGIALKDQGKLDEAIEAYNQALSIKSDHADAYNNTTELLKTYRPKIEMYQSLFTIDSKIKNLSPRILNATSDREIIDNLLEGLSYITEETFNYKTPLSQIYKRNTVDLNCKRHNKIFVTQDIIPEFCFGCFKVQVEVATVIDLVKVASLFYKFDFEEDLTKKTIIELRPNIPGFYKGLIYCKGLDQAKAVKTLLDISLKVTFGEETTSKIKRGCSEYPLKFPSYGEIPKNSKKIMSFPEEWRLLEEKFDQNELIEPKDNQMASLPEFCLSDFYIIQKWIDYAKGIGDQSIEIFNDKPIIFTDIYEKAKIRAIS